jgi:colanic acid biosynthesis glycosyl transferase WcaI
MAAAGALRGVAAVTHSPEAPHILFINEFYYPDVCASSAVLTDHLPKLAALRPHWRISVLAGDRAWDRPDARWPESDEHEGIDIHRVPRGRVRHTALARGLGFLRFHRAAVHYGRTLDRPDVVVASTAPPLGARIGLMIARRHGCPLIYKVLDLYPDCAAALKVIRPEGLMERIWRRIDTIAMQHAHAVVAVSERMADRIRSTRALPADKIHHIPDGFDPDKIRAGLSPARPADNPFRRASGLTDRFVVQYAGNMGLSHPFDTILAAVRELADDGRIAFQFIGAGRGRARVEQMIACQFLRVQLLDYQPAEMLADVLAAADVALISQHPRMFDLALPYKTYGIMAAGRPGIFIGDRRSEIAEWYNTAGCGLHVDQGDVAGLVGAIRRLSTQPDVAAEMGRRARKLFDQRFRSDFAAARWAELIDSVLRR